MSHARGGNPCACKDVRAAVLIGPHQIDLRSVKPASPTSEDAIVHMAASGICGTDLEIYSGHIPVAKGRILGHEGAGIVEEACDSRLEPGTKVVVDPVLSCGRCTACREGSSNLCAHGGLLGRDIDGLFADIVRVPAANCFPLPDAIELDDAPGIQVLATVVHAQEKVRVVPGRIAVVIGLGFSGQLHAQLLQLRGARVLGVTRSESKRAKAAELACEWTAPPEGADTIAQQVARDGWVDLVVEASGALPALAQAIEMVRPGGTVLSYGVYAAREGAVPFYSLYYKEIRLIGSRASRPRDMEIAIDLVATGRILVAPLISHRLQLDEIEKGFELSQKGVMKVMLRH